MPYRPIQTRSTPDRFLRTKAPETPARGIIDHRQQAALWATSLKPGMKAAIELHELAEISRAHGSVVVTRYFCPTSKVPQKAAPIVGCGGNT